jgi:hypothetical protein
MRHRVVEGSYNVRDLGGLRTEDGASTRSGVCIRAGNLDKLTSVGQRQLLSYGVRTIIDVRDEWEARTFPNVFSSSSEVIYHNVPLIGDALTNDAQWKTATGSYTYLHELYTTYSEYCKQQIRAIVTTIIESEPGAHSASGWYLAPRCDPDIPAVQSR